MSEFFTNTDIEQLRNNPSEYVKLDLISKIAKGFDDKHLTKKEKNVAADILKLLAQDISTRIRMNISEKFCRSEDIPYETIKQLADDIEDLVAIPIVQFSQRLTENDLLEIIQKDKGGKQRAVARREDLSEKLVDEIITHGSEYTLEALIDSNSSKICDAKSDRILNKFPKSEVVIGGLFRIDKIKPERAQDLLSIVSESLRNQIASKYDIPSSMLDSIVSTSKETVSYSMVKSQISQSTSDSKMKLLIAKLDETKQLNINLIIRILSGGNTDFFLLSLSQLCSVPKKNVELLVDEKGNSGILSLFKKGDLPANLATATKVIYRLTQKAIEENAEDTAQEVAKQLEILCAKNSDKQLSYMLNVIRMP